MKYNFTSMIKQNTLSKKVYILVIFLLLQGFNYSFAQSISSYENRLNVLRNSFSKESGILDSLKRVLNEKINEIDYAKKRNSDENNIKKMMAGTVTISNRIDERQHKISILEKELEAVKKTLNKRYTLEIDSLSALGNEKQSDYKTRILALTEKRILTAPKINSLTFNPEKILEINLAAATSQEEKRIYSEYLTSALNEVTNQLSQVKEISDEVNQIVILHKKSKKFLEESEFDFDMKATNVASRSSEQTFSYNKDATTTNGFITERQSIQMQSQSFIVLLKQLDLKQANDINIQSRFSFDNPNKQVSIKNYRELLKEVEKRLTDYRFILTNKLNPSK